MEKVRDIVGLYLNPPEHALVLCVDEKSQIQALERSQPLLPLGLGYVEGVTHDYKRHGTTTLFAALNIESGEVIAHASPAIGIEFLQFLRHIEAHDLDLHLVVDNYAPRSTPPLPPPFHPDLCVLVRHHAAGIRRGSFRKVKELIRH